MFRIVRLNKILNSELYIEEEEALEDSDCDLIQNKGF
jgi:hypothetical protein